jgi:D-ribose pyranose/furanose isomerase RbsD
MITFWSGSTIEEAFSQCVQYFNQIVEDIFVKELRAAEADLKNDSYNKIQRVKSAKAKVTDEMIVRFEQREEAKAHREFEARRREEYFEMIDEDEDEGLI